ncbi:MAG: type IV pilus secretin PilQ [Bdellovibrionales bacterium]
MMRFLLTFALVLQLGLGLTSCSTSTQSEDEFSAENEPIDEGDFSNSGALDEGGGDEFAEENTNDTQASDDFAEPAEEKPAETQAEDDFGNELDDEFAADDNNNEEDTGDEFAEENFDELEPAPTEQAEEPPPAELIEPEPVPEPVAPPVVEKTKVRDIRFVANSSGGTVVIETSQPVQYQTRMNKAAHQFIIELADVELPAALKRPYTTVGGTARIGGINAYQEEGSTTARVVVQLSSTAGSGEPVVQQEGTSLVVVPPAAPPPVAKVAPPTIAKPSLVEKPKGALQARTLDEFLTGNQQFFGKAISLQVKDADVRDVVNFLAEESGANIVMSDDVDGKISLKLRRIPWDQALVTVMRTKALGYVRQGNVLRISTLKALQAETKAASEILEAQKEIAPTVVEVIAVSYANLDELKKSLTPFLSKDSKDKKSGGNLEIDSRTSTVIVTDKADVVERIRKLVQTLDIPPGQVSIESKIVEATESFENFVGVNWSAVGAPLNLSPGGGADGAPIDLTMNMSAATLSRNAAASKAFNASINVGTLDFFGDLTAALTLAEQDNLAKVISAPRISAMNREKATIIQKGENVSLKTTTVTGQGGGAVIAKEPVRKEYKLELEVTPQITADGGVIMALKVTREFLGPVEDEETKLRATNTRIAETKVLVRNGQTAVVGGIYTNDELSSENGVPFLKNIPILGWLFKNRSLARSKTELLVFLTPRILAQDALQKTQANAAPVVDEGDASLSEFE